MDTILYILAMIIVPVVALAVINGAEALVKRARKLDEADREVWWF